MAIDAAFIKALAEANGLNIPDDRLETVLRQYQSFLRTMERIDMLPLEKETEPAILFTHVLNSPQPGALPRPDGEGR